MGSSIQTYYLRTIVNRPEILEELNEAGISDLDSPQNIWFLFEYVEKLIEIKNYKDTGFSGAYHFVNWDHNKWPSINFMDDIIHAFSLCDERHWPNSKNDEDHVEFTKKVSNTWYGLQYRAFRKVMAENPEWAREHLQLHLFLYDAYRMQGVPGMEKLNEPENILLTIFDTYGAEFFLEETGPLAEGPWYESVELTKVLYDFGRIKDAISVCNKSYDYFPLDANFYKFATELQSTIQIQFKELADILIEAQELKIDTQELEKEALELNNEIVNQQFAKLARCAEALKLNNEIVNQKIAKLGICVRELKMEIGNSENLPREIAERVIEIDNMVNNVVENVALIRNKDLSIEDKISEMEKITIPFSNHKEISSLLENFQSLRNAEQNVLEQLAWCDYLLNRNHAEIMSDLLFLKLCNILESLLVNSVVRADDFENIISHGKFKNQSVHPTLRRAENNLKSHLEGTKSLTLGSMITVLDAIKNEECQECLLLNELRLSNLDSLDDLRKVKYFLSKKEQLGGETESIVQIRNSAAHPPPLGKENNITLSHVERLRSKMLEDTPQILQILLEIFEGKK